MRFAITFPSVLLTSASILAFTEYRVLHSAITNPGYSYFATGSPVESSGHSTPGLALMGGGDDLDEAFRWMCQRAARGNFVVLRASGKDEYGAYLKKLCPAIECIETLVITSRQGASQAFVTEKIRHAAALFIAGGGQDKYINYWQGTPVQKAINQVIQTRRPVGGTSAGLAVLGEYTFSALRDTVTSKEALANPYNPRMTIERGFLAIPHLNGTITDSHFAARDRMGRLIAFLARISKDGGTRRPTGIGIDENTAILLDTDGMAKGIGKGNAYFLKPSADPEECAAGRPLTYRHIDVYKLPPGRGQFDVTAWHGSGGTAYSLSVVRGTLASSLAGSTVY